MPCPDGLTLRDWHWMSHFMRLISRVGIIVKGLTGICAVHHIITGGFFPELLTQVQARPV